MRTSTIAGVLGGLALLLPLAACGGDGGGGSDVASISGDTKPGEQNGGKKAASPEEAMEAMRKYAGCMREHGIDMPDPDPDSGAMPAMPAVKPGEDPKMDEALEACRSLLPNGGERSAPSPEELDEMRKQAECLREHGLDVKVPTAENPGLALTLDADDPATQKALEACGMGGARTRMDSK